MVVDFKGRSSTFGRALEHGNTFSATTAADEAQSRTMPTTTETSPNTNCASNKNDAAGLEKNTAGSAGGKSKLPIPEQKTTSKLKHTLKNILMSTTSQAVRNPIFEYKTKT